MRMFSTVLVPDTKKGMEYVVTAEISSVNPEMHTTHTGGGNKGGKGGGAGQKQKGGQKNRWGMGS